MEQSSPPDSNAPNPDAQAWCVCGNKVVIDDAQEVTLPNGKPGWQGICPECGSRLFAIRRTPSGD